VDYPREFCALNLRFARRVVEVSGVSLPEALLRHTHLYMAFGLGRSFEPAAPFWQAFLAGLEQAADPVDYTFQVCCQAQAERPRTMPEVSFGCFTYAVWDGGRVRLHFFRATPGQSPLRRAHLPERVAELKALFAYVRACVPPAASVVGGSWLYNLEAYCRLFPAEIIRTAVADQPPETQYIALWGQFLDHAGQVKPDVAGEFLRRLQAARDLPGVLASFPFPVLRLEAPIEAFYRHFEIKGSV
jgi:hypothetical protein